MYIHGTVLTHFGMAANNMGEVTGNTREIQKIIWNEDGTTRVVVSSDSIRTAIRHHLHLAGHELTRKFDDGGGYSVAADSHKTVQDCPKIDDDLMGYMYTPSKTEAIKRKSPFDVANAVSISPYSGQSAFRCNFMRMNGNPMPFDVENLTTRFRYSFSIHVGSVLVLEHVKALMQAIGTLSRVGGNHSRFLFDFSPESIVLRVSVDPALKIMDAFDLAAECEPEPNGCKKLVRRVKAGNVDGSELFVAGLIVDSKDSNPLRERGANVQDNVVSAIEMATNKAIDNHTSAH